jgi:putative ABC transport system permease protein
MTQRIPLAWRQLMKEKRRLAAAIAGISFAVILMLVQLGFEDALLSSAGLQYAHLHGDLALISPEYQFVVATRAFPERRLYQALGVEGVESIAPVYLAQLPWKNPFNHRERTIFVMGFKPRQGVFDLDGVNENIPALLRPDTVLFDAKGRPEFGPVAETLARREPVVTEALDHRVEVGGLFDLGTSFGIDGTIITSDLNFFRWFPDRRPGEVNIGLIMLKPGVNPERARAEVEAALPKDVTVLTHQGLVELERNYWETNTPIGFVFKLGLVMGMFVGSIIVYQILYTDVTDHLGEYATLKAMGYRDGYLFKVVIQESLILSIFGFIPGWALSLVVYKFAGDATLLPLRMPISRVLFVYALTAIMCAGSGALAMRKLRRADPAEIF